MLTSPSGYGKALIKIYSLFLKSSELQQFVNKLANRASLTWQEREGPEKNLAY